MTQVRVGCMLATETCQSDDNPGDQDQQAIGVIEPIELWDDFEKAQIKQRIAIFLAKLICFNSVVQSTIDGVVEQRSGFLDDVVGFLKDRSRRFAETNGIGLNEASFISLMDDFEKCQIFFYKFKGDYLRMKYSAE